MYSLKNQNRPPTIPTTAETNIPVISVPSYDDDPRRGPCAAARKERYGCTVSARFPNEAAFTTKPLRSSRARSNLDAASPGGGEGALQLSRTGNDEEMTKPRAPVDGERGSSGGGPNWVRTSDLSGVNGALFH